MDKKTIAILLVIIVVLGAAVFAITSMGNDDDNESPIYSGDSALPVYGNANEDYKIDGSDLAIIEEIIDGKSTLADHPLADANADGVVDEADVELVKKIIAEEPCNVYHISYYKTGNKVVQTAWPVKSALATGAANMLMILTLVGADSMVHGICYSSTSVPNSALFPGFSQMPSLGSTSTSMTVDGAKDVISKYDVTAFIVDHTVSTISNEDDFEKQGVDVIRIDPATVDFDKMGQEMLLLGFLFGTQTQVQSILQWQDDVMEEINGRLSSVTDKVSAITVNGTAGAKGLWVSAGASNYTAVLELAGATIPLDIDVLKADGITKYDGGAYFGHGDTWLYKYDFDKIISLKTGGWYSGDIDIKEIYEISLECLEETEAYKNGQAYVVTGDAPVIVRIMYSAVALYPDLFDQSWADELNQEFFEKFYPYDIDFTGLFFIVTHDMYVSATTA